MTTQPIAKTHGIKMAKAVIAQAERWAARDLKKGDIDRAGYDERMARIEAERRACGLA